MRLTKENFDKSPIGEWKCERDEMMDTLLWRNPNTDVVVYATPSWEEDDETPIEIHEADKVLRVGSLVHKCGTVEEKNEYVRNSLKNYLDLYN